MKKLDRNENKSLTAILKPNDEPLKRCESENFVLLPAGQMAKIPPSKTDYGGGVGLPQYQPVGYANH